MLNLSQLKKELQVAYTSGNYSDDEVNPKWGGKWGRVVGYIHDYTTPSVSDGRVIITVKFPELGVSNLYTLEDLTAIEDLEENKGPERKIQGLFNI